jgi:trk system potassium uptake protein TrkH
VLIAGAAVCFFFFEYQNVLRGRPWDEVILVSLFQAVTPRTAGFNTVSYDRLTNSALMMTIILMFVGGSPGSTAGGIKTSTAAILFGILISRARGMRHATLFRRTVPERVVGEAIAIVLLSMAVVMGMTFVLQWTELHDLAHPGVRGDFLSLNFEAVSAFGTVGLSMGDTPGLTSASKLVIIVLMFIGRLGPLTLAVALGRRRRVEYQYAEEEVLVG